MQDKKQKIIHYVFKTKNGRRTIASIIGLYMLERIISGGTIFELIENMEGDPLIYGLEIAVQLPIAIFLVLIGTIPILTKIHTSFDFSVKRGIKASLSSALTWPIPRSKNSTKKQLRNKFPEVMRFYNVNLALFFFWGSFLSFSISTFVLGYSLDWILNVLTLIPPEISYNAETILSDFFESGGPEFVTFVFTLLISGFIALMIYKIVYFGGIWGTNFSSLNNYNTSDKEIGRFSTVILLLCYLGIISYINLFLTGKINELVEWKQFIIENLPLICLGMALMAFVGVLLLRFSSLLYHDIFKK